MAHFAGIGLGTTLVPGVLWARMQDAGASQLTLAMVTDALKLSGIDLSEEDRKQMVESANRNLTASAGAAQDRDPARRLAAVSLQRDRAWHSGQQDQDAVPHERGAGGQASGESRGRRRSGRCAISPS